MNWVQINIQVNEDFRYMKIHIFVLRWRDEIKRSSQLAAILHILMINAHFQRVLLPDFRIIKETSE